MNEGGFDSWQTLFANKFDQRGLHNTERPVLLPWTLSKGTPGDIVMIRNPYYWVVDPAGNQLPYIDELYRFMELELETINLKALAGELDIARVSMETYNIAKDREDQGKIVAARYAASDRVHTAFGFNLTHKDPVLREIFRDKRFRFATSYALNREQMNELVFNGLSRPWQDGTPEGDPYYHERLATTATEYDPDKANALLDEMGLEKGSDGFRRRPDGSKLQITMISRTNRGPGERIAELIADDLKAVGLDVNLRIVERSLMVETCRANEIEMKVDDGGAAGMTFSGYFEGHLVPAHPTCPFSPGWQRWGVDPSTGEEPLPAMQEAMAAYRAGFRDHRPGGAPGAVGAGGRHRGRQPVGGRHRYVAGVLQDIQFTLGQLAHGRTAVRPRWRQGTPRHLLLQVVQASNRMEGSSDSCSPPGAGPFSALPRAEHTHLH